MLYLLLFLPFLLYIGFLSWHIYACDYVFLFYAPQTRLLIPLFAQSECQRSEELSWYYLNVDKDKMWLFFMRVNLPCLRLYCKFQWWPVTMSTIALQLHERSLENSSSMHSFITNFRSIKRFSYDLKKWFRSVFVICFIKIKTVQLFINYHKFYRKQYPLPAVSRLASRGEQWLHVCNIYTDRSQERLEKKSS